MTEIQPICTGCGNKPEDLDEYIECAAECDMTPDEYVKAEEGTYNPLNGHFLCSPCYINAGMPAVPYPGRWVAP